VEMTFYTPHIHLSHLLSLYIYSVTSGLTDAQQGMFPVMFTYGKMTQNAQVCGVKISRSVVWCGGCMRDILCICIYSIYGY